MATERVSACDLGAFGTVPRLGGSGKSKGNLGASKGGTTGVGAERVQSLGEAKKVEEARAFLMRLRIHNRE